MCVKAKSPEVRVFIIWEKDLVVPCLAYSLKYTTLNFPDIGMPRQNFGAMSGWTCDQS